MKTRKRKRGSSKRRPHSSFRTGFIIALIVLIPVSYGIYLYCQQERLSQERNRQTTELQPTDSYKEKEQAISLPLPKQDKSVSTANKTVNSDKEKISTKDLEIPHLPHNIQAQLIKHTGYTVSYNKHLRIPNWVSYELTRQEAKGKEKRGDQFISDPQVQGTIATNSDYKRSGYDKGHMAPAGDMKWSETAMKESFYFSNICPQHPQLNRRGWKELEEEIREWVEADSAIIVICGPIVSKNPKTIGKNKVVIPKQFFKVLLSPYTQPMKAIGFLFNNQMAVEPLSTYAVTVDSIEQLTGIDFFAPLPDNIEKRIESDNNYRRWIH